MTRSLTITNTSNWDGENYSVDGLPYQLDTVILRPGESMLFMPDANADKSPTFTAVDGGMPSPFVVPETYTDSDGVLRCRNKNVVPRVKVVFE